MKLITWNVNGLRAVIKKGFYEFMSEYNPDIICLQEIKAHKEQVELNLPDYPYQYWNSAIKKGYSGTAIFSKIKPLNYENGIQIDEHDNEGRVITLEFEEYYLVTVYTPNSGDGLKRLDYRASWDERFLKYLQSLENKKLVILCGDLNVAHTDIDLKNAKANYNKSAGYTQTEIDGLERYLNHGFIDTFREFEKGPHHYSYWS